MDYITKTTRCTSYGIYPRSLLQSGLTKTAIVAYLLLLDRAMVSQANDWLDEQGRVYIIYPIEKLAEAMGMGTTAVKHALHELEERDFIERRRQGLGQANHILVKLTQAEIRPSDRPVSDCPNGRKSDLPTDGSATTNYTKNNQHQYNYANQNYRSEREKRKKAEQEFMDSWDQLFAEGILPTF